MFYLTTHSTHFIYGYMASDIWLRTILIVRKETRCRHIGYSYRLTARVILYASSHRQDNTYHGLCYTSRGVIKSNTEMKMIYGPSEIEPGQWNTVYFILFFIISLLLSIIKKNSDATVKCVERVVNNKIKHRKTHTYKLYNTLSMACTIPNRDFFIGSTCYK